MKTVKIDLEGGCAAYVFDDLTMGQMENMEWLEAVWATSGPMVGSEGKRLASTAILADLIAAVVSWEGFPTAADWPPLPPVLTTEAPAIATRAGWLRANVGNRTARRIQRAIVERMTLAEELEGN